jgi:hypothetical protein
MNSLLTEITAKQEAFSLKQGKGHTTDVDIKITTKRNQNRLLALFFLGRLESSSECQFPDPFF